MRSNGPHRRFGIGLVVATGLVLTAFQPNHAASEAKYGVAVMRDVMVPMRDGVKLATDIYMPTNPDGSLLGGKVPTILQRTPYNKEGGPALMHYFASRGYASVSQDARGRFKSEGIWGGFVNDDANDGYDACAWIVKQAWSDGKIGMIGTSYLGGTQHAAAMEKPPGLTTVIPVDAVSNMGYQSMRNGGAFELRFFNWIYTQLPGARQSRDPATAKMLQELADKRVHYLLNLPLLRGTTPLKYAAEYEEWLVRAMEEGGNTDFWKQNSIIDYPQKYKDIPVYLVGGWYDSWAGNTSSNYKVLSKAIKGPVYLIFGPWIHGQQGGNSHGQVYFGKDAAIPDPLAWRLEWYDKWLKGVDNSVGTAAPFRTPVRVFVMGTGDGRKTPTGLLNHGGYWREEQEWPLARTQYTKYYLQGGGGLSTTVPTTAQASTAYTFDPANPVPTIGGNISSGNGIMLQGAWDQRGGDHIWNWKVPIPLSARRDVLVFQTEPIGEDVEVTGEIEVKLYAASSSVDTDFTAKLIDVYPPNADFPGGFDLNLEDGIVRGRFRESLKVQKLLTPGEVSEFTVKLYPTSNVFKKGHRIRVDVSSSNFPRFDVNPNTGDPLNRNHRLVVATNTVYHDKAHTSHVVLPVVPRAQTTTAGREQ